MSEAVGDAVSCRRPAISARSPRASPTSPPPSHPPTPSPDRRRLLHLEDEGEDDRTALQTPEIAFESSPDLLLDLVRIRPCLGADGLEGLQDRGTGGLEQIGPRLLADQTTREPGPSRDQPPP